MGFVHVLVLADGSFGSLEDAMIVAVPMEDNNADAIEEVIEGIQMCDCNPGDRSQGYVIDVLSADMFPIVDEDEYREASAYRPYKPGSWYSNNIQFPRLLAEIIATQSLNIDALCESMDLTPEDIDSLLERAQSTWDRIVAGT